MYLSQTSSFWNHSPGWFKALGHIHTNPGKKVSGFRLRGRVDGAKCNGRSRPSNKKVWGGGEGAQKKKFFGGPLVLSLV